MEDPIIVVSPAEQAQREHEAEREMADLGADQVMDVAEPEQGDQAGGELADVTADEEAGSDRELRRAGEAPVVAHEPIVPLGRRIGTDEDVSWTGSTVGSPHVFVLGITGQGKSWTVLRLLAHTTPNIPMLVLDFHGEYAMPGTPFSEIVSPRVLDAAKGLPFSPFEASARREGGASYWKMNSLALAEILEYVFGLGEIQRDLVYRAIRDSYLAAGFGDEGEGDSPPDLPTVQEVMERLERLEAKSPGTRNVVARCRPLFEFDLFRPGALDAATFSDLVRQPCVVDLHAVGHETLQQAAGAFLLRKLYKDMFAWGQTDCLRLLVVLDEAHRLAKDVTLPLLMKEGRKFGVALVLASQSPADFHRDVVGNAGTRIIFRMNYPESMHASKFLTPNVSRAELAARIQQLQVGHAFVQVLDGYRGKVAMYPYRSP